MDILKGTIPSLCEHFSSGCHGAATSSAPSLLPFLSLLPPKALTTEGAGDGGGENGAGGNAGSGVLSGILTAVWDGWSVCCTPSRSADAAALLRAMREGLLYGVLIAAKTAKDPAAFRTRLLTSAVAERWGPEALGTEAGSAGAAGPYHGPPSYACPCDVSPASSAQLKTRCLPATVINVSPSRC